MKRPTGDTEEMQRRVAENLKTERSDRLKAVEEEEKAAAEILKKRVDPKVLQQAQMDRLLNR